jgi:CRISPR-associated protein Csb3
MSFEIRIDPGNPGQYFAACGLMELANHLQPDITAAFPTKGVFEVRGGGDLKSVLDSLVDCRLTNTMTQIQIDRLEVLSEMSSSARRTENLDDEKKALEKLRREEPIVLTGAQSLRIDWFRDTQSGGSRFKTWAGQQSVLEIASNMKEALTGESWRTSECLSYFVTDGGLPFNFDSDLGGQGGAIDVGFSFDPLAASSLTKIAMSARPALELLAFIGLQRFRPWEVPRDNRFLYTSWKTFLPIEVAAPTACGAITAAGSPRSEFRLLYRTKYLKSFLPAIPFNGGSNE